MTQDVQPLTWQKRTNIEEHQQFFSKINEIIDNLAPTVDEAEQAIAQATQALTGANAAITTANAASAAADAAAQQAQTAADTVAGYNTRLIAVEDEAAGNTANITALQDRMGTAEGKITALQGVQADYVKKDGAAQTVTSQIMVPTTATGLRDTQIANGTRIQNDLDNYAGMIRTTGNQIKSGQTTFTSTDPIIVKTDDIWAGPTSNFHLKRVIVVTDKDGNNVSEFYPTHDANGGNHTQICTSAYTDNGEGVYNVKKRACLDIVVSAATGKARVVFVTPNGTNYPITEWMD